MREEVRTWGERRLLRWSQAVRRRSRPILALALILTGTASWYATARLGVNTDTSSLVADDLEFRRLYRDFKAAFGDIDDELIVLIEAETPALADAAAGRLAAELAADTATFLSVYRPDGGPWFERVGLLLRETDEVVRVTDRVAPYVGLLADLERDPTFDGLSGALEEILAGRREATADTAGSPGPDLVPVLGLLAATTFAATEGRFAPAPWSALASGEAPSARERRQTLSLRPRLSFANAVPGRAGMDRVREAALALGLIDRNGIRVHLTGIVAIEAEELDTAMAGVRQTGALAGIAVALILFLGLRSARLVMAGVLTLAAGLVVTSAFAAAAVGSLNLISVAFAVLYVGLGIDYAIHLCLRYRSNVAHGRSPDEAVDLAVVEVGPSLCVSAVTTAACFYAFIPTDFTGVSELGLIGGTGMFISVFATLTLLPALLTVFPLREPPRGAAHGMPALGGSVRRLRAPLLLAAVVATVGSLVVLPRAWFDANPLNLRDPASESVLAYRTLLGDPVAKPLTLSLLASDSASAHLAAERLTPLPEVEGVRTLESFIPTEQELKLGALTGLDLPPASPRVDRPSAPELERFRALLHELRWSASPDERTIARQLDVLLGRWDRRASEWSEPERELQARALETAWLGGLPDQVRRLRAAAAGPVDAATAPADLRQRWVTPDGRRRVEVIPRDPLLTTAELERFVEAAQEVEPAVTGDAVNQFGTGRVAVGAFRNALLGAAAVTMVLLVVLMRSVLVAGLVVLPLAAAAAWTGALTVWLEAPFNFANVIALPLLLGVGVDNGIHIVHQVRARPDRPDPLAASTGRAVWFASLTTMASFGNLAFSVHVGMASMGRLLTLGMACVLVGTLLVLPALLGLPAIGRRVAPGYTNGAAAPPRSDTTRGAGEAR